MISIVLRFVLDTDVIVAALRSPRGASAAILRAATAGQVRLLSSVALVLEYDAKCTLSLDAVRFFEERTNRADLSRFRQILNRPGGEPPQAGDELPS